MFVDNRLLDRLSYSVRMCTVYPSRISHPNQGIFFRCIPLMVTRVHLGFGRLGHSQLCCNPGVCTLACLLVQQSRVMASGFYHHPSWPVPARPMLALSTQKFSRTVHSVTRNISFISKCCFLMNCSMLETFLTNT